MILLFMTFILFLLKRKELKVNKKKYWLLFEASETGDDSYSQFCLPLRTSSYRSAVKFLKRVRSKADYRFKVSLYSTYSLIKKNRKELKK